ncbi:membrane or secreted protein [gut metagenome]|uniref:Membrane or secreted protein n=1 Tax=gut metagenome TaxID=749906 RepID=J9GFU2_9ZZZZ
MMKPFVTRATALAMAVLFAFSLVGCGAKPTEPVAGSKAASSEQQPAVAQELVIGENVDLGGFDPTKEMSPFIRFLVFDCLVELGYDSKNFLALPPTGK